MFALLSHSKSLGSQDQENLKRSSSACWKLQMLEQWSCLQMKMILGACFLILCVKDVLSTEMLNWLVQNRVTQEVSDSIPYKNYWKSGDKKLSCNYTVFWSFILRRSNLFLVPNSAAPIDWYLVTEKEEPNKNARKVWLKMKQINLYSTVSWFHCSCC